MFRTVAARKALAQLVFAGVWIVGIVQSVLLGNGVGEAPGVRYGLGIPLTALLVASGLAWFLLARTERRSRA